MYNIYKEIKKLMTAMYSTPGESFTGASCTGSDGTKSRKLTLTGTNIVDNSVAVYVDGLRITNGVSNDYTYVSNIVTYNNAMFDTQKILVTYVTTNIV